MVKAYEIEFTVDNCSEDEKSEFQLGSGGKSQKHKLTNLVMKTNKPKH